MCVWKRGWKSERIDSKLLLYHYYYKWNDGKLKWIFCNFLLKAISLTIFFPTWKELKIVGPGGKLHPPHFPFFFLLPIFHPLIFHLNQTLQKGVRKW